MGAKMSRKIKSDRLNDIADAIEDGLTLCRKSDRDWFLDEVVRMVEAFRQGENPFYV